MLFKSNDSGGGGMMMMMIMPPPVNEKNFLKDALELVFDVNNMTDSVNVKPQFQHLTTN